jgi:hypothetical protein
MYPSVRSCEEKIEQQFIQLNGDTFRSQIEKKKKQTKRFRFMSRGEAFTCFNDIKKVEDIVKKNKNTKFWIPTRAWRNDHLLKCINTVLGKYDNVYLIASMDPSNTKEEWKKLKENNWSTMFFGDDTLTQTPNGDKFIKCKKTWEKKKGHCQRCSNGCFSNKRTDVILKKH